MHKSISGQGYMDKDSSQQMRLDRDERLNLPRPTRLECDKRGKQHRFLQEVDFLLASTPNGVVPKAAANHLAYLRLELNYSLLKPEYVPELPF